VAGIVGPGTRLDEATSKGYPIGSFGEVFPGQARNVEDFHLNG
jgi:hypothetical protein